MNTSEKLLKNLYNQLNELQNKINWINQIANKIDTLPEDIQEQTTLGYYGLDFDQLSHDNVMKVIQAFPGSWDKNPNNGRVDYILQQEPFYYRCWRGEPPPNCKVVEVDEVIPAQPERIEKRLKLVCESMTAQAANLME